jgi:hypothetical protein
VFEAPDGFPSGKEIYASNDALVIALLSEAMHVEVKNSLAPEQRELFGGMVP